MVETRQLETRIASLRGQVRRLLALHGSSWVVALVLPLVDFLAVVDAKVVEKTANHLLKSQPV